MDIPLVTAMWRAFILLCLAAGSRQLSILEFTVPAALEVGEDAELQCKYELLKNETDRMLFVKWWWTPLNDTNDERYLLYQRIAGHQAELSYFYNSSIEILDDDGLRLLNVTPKASGVYECEVSNIDEVRKHQKLVVFSTGNGPQLNVSVTEEDPETADDAVLVTCEATDVAPRPDLVITLNGKQVTSSGYVEELEDGLYEISENATFSLDEANDGDFKCEIVFDDVELPYAMYAAEHLIIVPSASTPADDPTEPTTTDQPPDNGCSEFAGSWMLLTSISLLILLLHDHTK